MEVQYFCKYCGRNVPNNACFCPQCGSKLKNKKVGRGYAISSLVLGIVSCVYVTLFFFAYLGGEKVLFNPPSMFFAVFTATTILAITFGAVAHFKGSKLAKRIAGFVLGSISLVELIILLMLYINKY